MCHINRPLPQPPPAAVAAAATLVFAAGILEWCAIWNEERAIKYLLADLDLTDLEPREGRGRATTLLRPPPPPPTPPTPPPTPVSD